MRTSQSAMTESLAGLLAWCLIGLVVLGTGGAAFGIENCKAVTNRKSGLIEVSASGVQGTPHWGIDAEAAEGSFGNFGACSTGERLKGCTLFDPDVAAAVSPPNSCILYVSDDSGFCKVFIRDCKPSPQDRCCDGVTSINQARALAGGITPGDEPGFPVRITIPGSYRLTSNLDLGGESEPQDATAIEVVTRGVSIDLNGFSITSTTTCSDSGVCAPTGTGRGIRGDWPDVTVANGIVSGFGEMCLLLGERAHVERVHASHCGFVGIRVGIGSLVLDSTAALNGSDGIAAEGGSRIHGNVARNNGSTGIFTADNTQVLQNQSFENEQDGIWVGEKAIIESNVVTGNGGNGIRAGAKCILRDNTAHANTLIGLNCHTDDVTYAGNTMIGNTGGAVSGGTQIGTNYCENAICP